MATRMLTGYHGTSRQLAARILLEGFVVSRNPYDWLGAGAYFWQDAPRRAMDWAVEEFGSEATVIEAQIEFRDFINLLDTEWMSWLTDVHDQYLIELRTSGKPLPVQTNGAHRLDRAVIDFGVSLLEASGITVRGIVGAFREGRPVFTNSALYSESHVQIAVRDLSLIANSRILSPSEVPNVRRTDRP